MELGQSSAATIQVVSGAGSVVSAAGSIVTTGWSVDLFGVPVSAVLAAFAGAGFVLAWLPVMPLPRLITSVLFSAIAAMYAGPALVDWFNFIKPGHLLIVTLAIAAVLQIVMPMVIENRAAIVGWVLARLPWRSSNSDAGGKQ